MLLCSIMMCVAFVDCFFIRFYHVDVLTSGYKKPGPGRRSNIIISHVAQQLKKKDLSLDLERESR